MGFSVAEGSNGKRGGRGTGVTPSMNVTPLVDVVLVLLIIFMVVTPLLVKQVSVRVPEPPDRTTPPPTDALPPSVLIELSAGGFTTLNHEAFADEALRDKLARVLAARTDKVVFFKAAPDVQFGRAMEIIDTIKSVGGILAVQPTTEGSPRSTPPVEGTSAR